MSGLAGVGPIADPGKHVSLRPGRGSYHLVDPDAGVNPERALGGLFHPNQHLAQAVQNVSPVIAVAHPSDHLVHFRLGLLQIAISLLEPDFFLLLRPDVVLHRRQHFGFDLGQPREQEAHGGDDRHQAEHGGDEVRLFLVEALPPERALRHEIELDRAMRQVAQAQADDFAERMRHARQFLEVERRDRAERCAAG